MAKCKECGYELQGNEKACPNCGCPCSVEQTNMYEKDVLSFGNDTEAESTVKDVAESIKKWFHVLAIICLIYGFVAALGSLAGVASGAIHEGPSFLIVPIISICIGIIGYIVLKLIGKAIWAVMMLFVNMSVTMRRIEIQNSKK